MVSKIRTVGRGLKMILNYLLLVQTILEKVILYVFDIIEYILGIDL